MNHCVQIHMNSPVFRSARNLATLPKGGYYQHQPINLLGCTPLHRLDYNILEEKIDETCQNLAIRRCTLVRARSNYSCWRTGNAWLCGATTNTRDDDLGGYRYFVCGSNFRRYSRYVGLLFIHNDRSPVVCVLKSAHIRTRHPQLTPSRSLAACVPVCPGSPIRSKKLTGRR